MSSSSSGPTGSAGRSEPTRSHVGQYRLLTRLGQGGMGDIHLALSSKASDFEKLVVLKELRPDLASNSGFSEMFLREAKLAGRLNHANIVQTLEAGQIDGRYVMAMEFLDGQPFSRLMQRMDELPRIPTNLRIQVICDTLMALHYAHELEDFDGRPLNIVHCDVSFPNVFLTYDGHVKVIDFGVAKVAGKVGESQFRGKLRYAAPEQLTGESVDRRADIFSTGVMLWECVALQRFAPRTDDPEEILRHVESRVHDLSRIVPGVDVELSKICARALRVNPADRFETAEEFRKALGDYLSRTTQRMEPSEIARLMQTKFAADRAELHELIQAKLGGKSPHAVEGSGPTDVGFDDVTTVADLSELVESIKTKEPRRTTPSTVVTQPALKNKLTMGILGAALAVSVSLCAWLLWRQGQSDELGPRDQSIHAESGPAATQSDPAPDPSDVAARAVEPEAAEPGVATEENEATAHAPTNDEVPTELEGAAEPSQRPRVTRRSAPAPSRLPGSETGSKAGGSEARGSEKDDELDDAAATGGSVFERKVQRTNGRELRPLETTNPFR